MASENETFDEVLRFMQNDIVHFAGKPVKHSRDLLQEYHDRFKAAHHREVAELKSKMNDVVCENEALRDACGTCGAKREREATREKSSRVGNAAKMREALVKAKKAICHHAKYVCQSLSWENSDIQSNCGDILCAHRDLCEAKTAINAALASPPRNCDVGTDEEQSRRYEELCDRHTCGSRCSASGCPMYEHDCSPFAWGQMPYEEGGAK